MSLNEINEKLVTIQKRLVAPKSKFNSFAKFNYRSAEDILEAVKPLVHAEGLSLIISDDIIHEGNANYVKATALLTDGENTVEARAFAREAETKKGMDEAQITGSASSYARKYALSGLFAIDDTKDPDGQDNTKHEAKRPAEKQSTMKDDVLAEAKNQLNKMLEEYGHDNAVKKKVVIQSVLKKATVETTFEANEVMQALEDGAV